MLKLLVTSLFVLFPYEIKNKPKVLLLDMSKITKNRFVYIHVEFLLTRIDLEAQ